MATLYRTLDLVELAVAALVLAGDQSDFSLWIRSFSGTSSTSYATRFASIRARIHSWCRTAARCGVVRGSVSRIAKNFQDYFVNVIRRRLAHASTPMAFDISGSPVHVVWRISARQLWGSCSGYEAMSRSHRTAGEHGVHDSDRPNVRYDLRRQGTLVRVPSLFVTVPLLGRP